MSLTIQETIRQLHAALRDYIEATYHISSPSLIDQRRRLLDQIGIIHQVPFIESTPRYKTERKFADLGLPRGALDVLTALSTQSGGQPRLLYDPPYTHQADSLSSCLVHGKNLVIMTGTGSGKTESFLMPIIGKLAREARGRPNSFRDQYAMRAMVMYPMNALVNDQLGRLRALFGDPRLVNLFREWAGRPPRFARYTSRTPYAGVRDTAKDSRKLKSFDEFYVEIERRVSGPDSDEQQEAARILSELKSRGKWPAKPSLVDWFGQKGSPWQDRKTQEFLRAVTRVGDSELLTRYEVQAVPPDLLVTNYSMLEYMLMRPIERTIFDQTKEWLKQNPAEKFLVVLDEAHLYRGAAGAEVGLLLRRLRDRLECPKERFQVICATASFKDPDYAKQFGAQLSGLSPETFISIQGDLALRNPAAVGTPPDADALADIDLSAFFQGTTEAARRAAVAPLLKYRGVASSDNLERDLHAALSKFPPLNKLVNATMQGAQPVEELGDALFPSVARSTADAAVTSLMALGSMAREDSKSPGLLPCRIHNFFRGLPGLWVCMDPKCTALGADSENGICGKMYGQPRDRCECDARVLELYTCRYCGTAYARAYTDDVDSPSALWAAPGGRLRIDGGETSPLLPLDLLLEEPAFPSEAELFDYDLETGRLNSNKRGERMRSVYLRKDRITPPIDEDGETDTSLESRGQFIPCGCCGKTSRGRSYVQDHQTKGDQPFEALVSQQIQIQPPNAVEGTKFAPLRGRKVLVFSDSRQVAARLAPNLQMYSVRDSLRPLIAWGFNRLQQIGSLQILVSMEDLYFAVLLASKKLRVRLRPELKQGESFSAEELIEDALNAGKLGTDPELQLMFTRMRSQRPPEALLDDIISTVQNPFLGFEALALASIAERLEHQEVITKLPVLPNFPDTSESKIGLTRAWLRCWRNNGFWLNQMPTVWWNRPKSQGTSVKGKKGKGTFEAMKTVLQDKDALKTFNKEWLPELQRIFAEDAGGILRLRGSEITLLFEGSWVRCSNCKSVHRPVAGISHCLDCGRNSASPLDPEADAAFKARKGYYRNPVIAALGPDQRQPMALIAAEHTAQLNAPQNEDVFSKAEQNELLFQDVSFMWGREAQRATAIDVLSSTTTMEVGIDIGALSGVALRNMPPGRANYQQRAGRAGRRGNAVATVIAFGSADSHDEHYFTNPSAMIRGDVVDPKLTLDNKEIVRRHIRAYLLQNYHQDRLPEVDTSEPQDLFSVLGKVSTFRDPNATLNRRDLELWLNEKEAKLKQRIASWIPGELSPDDRQSLLDEMKQDMLAAIDAAVGPAGDGATTETDDDIVEEQPEVDEEKPPEKPDPDTLLDRLLYRGVLPRYAFPTDVATFHVFDQARSTHFRPIMRFAPSQGLPIALTQYAPGKQIWISGKCYTSGAVYSVMADDRYQAWNARRIYRECAVCGFARTIEVGAVERGATEDCEACGSSGTFGPARFWLRPPGFAHPVDVPEVTSPDEIPETSYATRAKLTMETPVDPSRWSTISERVRVLRERQHLLVSNTGPKKEGYSYCTRCGRIEASSEQTPTLFAPHPKPFIDDKEPTCDGNATTRHIVLGTDFITDIALFSMTVKPPLRLRPGQYPTDVALRTVSEALAKAGSQMLEIEPGELMAEFRPALTPSGQAGLEAEIFLYDTLAGGAGFSSQLVDRGPELIQRAMEILKSCPGNCDASCYRCLRSFKNKFEHNLLDRHVGAELLDYLVSGRLPRFDPTRLRKSTDQLFADLVRQDKGGADYQRNADVSTGGKTVVVPILAVRASDQVAVGLSGPLTPDYPADESLAQLRQSGFPVFVVNELLVRGSLPTATLLVQHASS